MATEFKLNSFIETESKKNELLYPNKQQFSLL